MRRPKTASPPGALALLALLTGSLSADVLVEEIARTQIGPSTSTETAEVGWVVENVRTGYQGVKRYRTGTARLIGGPLSTARPDSAALATVTRPDLGLTWSIDHHARQYEATPLDHLVPEADGPRHEVTGHNLTFDPSGNRRTVAGVECDERVAVLYLDLVDSASRLTTYLELPVSFWLAPDTTPFRELAAAERAFGRALDSATGSPTGWADAVRLGLEVILTQFNLAPAEVQPLLNGVWQKIADTRRCPLLIDAALTVNHDLDALAVPDPSDTPPVQHPPPPDILHRYIREVRSVHITDLPAAAFEAPRDYTLPD